MTERSLAVRIERRINRAGGIVQAPDLVRLTAYLELLARWNRKINLTGLVVDPPTDDAIDRLIVEPVAAARFVSDNDHLTIDIGSGGGSPAIPLKIVRPNLRFVLVEVKVRKCAFLREAVRTIGLPETEIENRRYEELLSRSDLHRSADLVVSRAVRIDHQILRVAHALLRPGGRVILFQSGSGNVEARSRIPEFERGVTESIVPALGSQIEIMTAM